MSAWSCRMRAPASSSCRFSLVTVVDAAARESFCLASSALRSSIRSAYCWFSIFSFSKSTAWSTSPISSFCRSVASACVIWFRSVLFVSVSFSAVDSLARTTCSECLSHRVGSTSPVRSFTAPIATSLLKSCAVFLSSWRHASTSSHAARRFMSPRSFAASVSRCTRSSSSDSAVTASRRSASVSRSRTTGASVFALLFLLPLLRLAPASSASSSGACSVPGGAILAR
mmetsp:Transcript_2184/g.9256  ORF Transcript_2184/g.9256 Transcript_2184/m.9256 type:complete len:228 (+) Transcript_2184:304-987(+)